MRAEDVKKPCIRAKIIPSTERTLARTPHCFLGNPESEAMEPRPRTDDSSGRRGATDPFRGRPFTSTLAATRCALSERPCMRRVLPRELRTTSPALLGNGTFLTGRPPSQGGTRAGALIPPSAAMEVLPHGTGPPFTSLDPGMDPQQAERSDRIERASCVEAPGHERIKRRARRQEETSSLTARC